MTNGAPIAKYSEQGSEAWNKHIRAYRSGPGCRARFMNNTVNIKDTFTRMYMRSHPLIAKQKRVLRGIFGVAMLCRIIRKIFFLL